MGKQESLQRVLQGKLVAVVRAPDGQQLVEVAKALHRGGISAIEITMTVPGAVEVIRQVASALGNQILLGAGTVLDAETARAVLLAGAEFVVSPTVNAKVIRLCQRYDKLVMPGAFTPTEILSAWELGADIVKVFPADVGGPNYLKSIHGPLPQIRLMPTGGVDLKTAGPFLKAGACALGLGSSLVDKEALKRGDFDAIADQARLYVKIVEEHRGSNELATKQHVG